MLYLFLAPGFEETEAMAPLDVLRRAGVSVQTVGVGGNAIPGAHGVTFLTDLTTEEVALTEALDGVILPGGMPGTKNLEADPTVQKAIDFCHQNQKLLCAICAAPSIFGHKHLLAGKKATCFPGFETELLDAVLQSTGVVTDGEIITANGAGTALLFGEAIAAKFVGEENARQILKTMQYPFG